MDKQQQITASISRTGLTTDQAGECLRQFGPNRVEEEWRHPLRSFLVKFRAPVPWPLELVTLEIAEASTARPERLFLMRARHYRVLTVSGEMLVQALQWTNASELAPGKDTRAILSEGKEKVSV